MSLNERLIPIVEDGASYGAAPSLQKAKTDKKSVLTTGRVLAAVAGVAGVAGVAALSSNSALYPGGLLGKSKDFEHVLHRQSKAFKGLAASRQEGIRMMAELTVRPIVNPGQPAHLGASEYEKCVDFNSKPAVYSKTDAGEVRLDLIYQNTREVATPVTAYADSERAVNAITCKEAPKSTFQEIGACTADKSFCDSNCYMPVPGNCAAGAKEFGSCTPTVTSVCGSISDTSAGCQKVSSEVVTKEGQYNNMQPGVAPCDAAPKADAVAAQGKYKEAYNEWVNAVNDATEVCTVGHALWVHNSGMYEKHYDELIEVTADLQAMCDQSSGENAFDFDKALAEAKKDNIPTVRRKLVWWQQLCEPTIESLKVLTASLEIVSPQLQCFAETCVAKRAAEVAAFTKLGSSYTAYKGAYDSYDAKATAYNTAVDDKIAQKEAVIAAYTAFHPTKNEAALTYNKDVAAFTRFDTGADKGHCGLSDCQIKAVCSTQITSKFDRFIKSDTCSAVPMSADKICSDGPVVEPVVDKGPECSGRTVTVKRMDRAGLDGHGWGMNLQFMCGDSKVSIGNSRGSQTQSTVVNTPMHKGDCVARIDKSNWLGGYTYPDFFDVTVTDCPGPAPVPVPEPVPAPAPAPAGPLTACYGEDAAPPFGYVHKAENLDFGIDRSSEAAIGFTSGYEKYQALSCDAPPVHKFEDCEWCKTHSCDASCPQVMPGKCADPASFGVCEPTVKGICDTLQQSHDGCTSGSKAVVEKSNEYLSVDVQNAPCAAPIMEDTFASLKKYKLAYNDWAMAFNNASQVCKVGANIREYNGISFMSMHKSLEDVERVANDACAEDDFDAEAARPKNAELGASVRNADVCSKLKDLTASMIADADTSSAQIQCFAAACIDLKAAEQVKLDALVAAHAEYEAKYLAYSAAITAYNQKVSDKNTLKAAVMESYEIFNPIKTTTVAKFDKDNVIYQKFESGAAKGSCGLSDCEMESVCGYAIAADADYYVEEKRGKCVQKNKDLVEHCHK